MPGLGSRVSLCDLYNVSLLLEDWSQIEVLTISRIWCLYFIDALEGTATTVMQPFVLSEFQAHSLVAVTPIMASIIGGVWRAPLAKVGANARYYAPRLELSC